MGLPLDIPLLGETEYTMDIRLSRWKEVEAVVRRAKCFFSPRAEWSPLLGYKKCT
uniref:Uncharacterized protein n=1 Tax=Anguilla anguilla TaxID=7936 RepID=A0A0E9V5X7_ANGAN